MRGFIPIQEIEDQGVGETGEQTYRVVFKGETSEGADFDDVKRKIGRSFKLDSARIEGLFSGQRVVLKKGAALETCEKIRETFKDAGAICHIVKEDGPHEKGIESPSSPEPEPPPLPGRQEREQKKAAAGKRERKADEKFCSSCGEIIQIKALSCPYCGAKQKKEGRMGCLPLAAIIVGIGVFVTAVLGILAAIAIPQFVAYRARTYETNIRAELHNLANAEQTYYREHQRYTANLNDLGFENSDPQVSLEIVQADEICYNAKWESAKARKILWMNCRGEIQFQEKSSGR